MKYHIPVDVSNITDGKLWIISVHVPYAQTI